MYKNGKWLYDKNTRMHRQSMMWKKSKEKHISFGAIVHIVARTERVGTQQWHLHPDCIHFCTQWGWPPPPWPRAPPIFSSGGEAGRYKKGPHSTRCLRGFNESADRHKKYNFCLLFKEGREKVEKRLHQQQRGRRRWDQVSNEPMFMAALKCLEVDLI